jgi:hypothetical protein
MSLRLALTRSRLSTSLVRAPLNRTAPVRAVAQRPYTAGSQKPSGSRPNAAAMAAVASLGFAAYYTLVKSREGQRESAMSCHHRNPLSTT